MKKIVSILFIFIFSLGIAQTRGTKIGYIDMEYILEKVPSYAESKNQLEKKAQKWKQEVAKKKIEIENLKKALETERVLLTKELIEEREDEILFLEKELFDYQEKRFGIHGDFIVQQSVLVKPIQDQVFTAIQDIAEKKRYDFILDKSSDLTVLFAKKQHDISDLVLRTILRSEKRKELTRKQLKEQEAKEAEEDSKEDNLAQQERQRILDERKAAREKLLEERKAARAKLLEDRKKAAEERRKKAEEKRNAQKNGTKVESDKTTTNDSETITETEATINKTAQQQQREKLLKERKQKLEKKKQEAKAKREKLLEERKKKLEARKKALEEKQKNKQKEKSKNQE